MFDVLFHQTKISFWKGNFSIFSSRVSLSYVFLRCPTIAGYVSQFRSIIIKNSKSTKGIHASIFQRMYNLSGIPYLPIHPFLGSQNADRFVCCVVLVCSFIIILYFFRFCFYDLYLIRFRSCYCCVRCCFFNPRRLYSI